MSAALLLQPLKTSSFKMSGVRCQNFGQDARRCSCPASHAAAPLRQFFAEQLGASWRIDRFLDASPSSTTAIPVHVQEPARSEHSSSSSAWPPQPAVTKSKPSSGTTAHPPKACEKLLFGLLFWILFRWNWIHDFLCAATHQCHHASLT